MPVHLKVREQRLEVLLKGLSVEEIRVWVQDEKASEVKTSD